MDLLRKATEILCEGTDDDYFKVHAILEDSESPITKKYTEQLYQMVIDKSHIDFGDIPNSRGNITHYSGFKTMNDTLNVLSLQGQSDAAYASIQNYVQIVQTAVRNMEQLAPLYSQAFSAKKEIVMLEYNTFVYTCVEATTSLLYFFTDFMRTPSSHTMPSAMSNTKYRADLFYVEQLSAFNNVVASGEYAKYLKGLMNPASNGYVGESVTAGFAIGAATIGAAALSIIPITRKLIYSFQNIRGRLSDLLALQAYYLEINKDVVKANTRLKDKKKEKVLNKQEKLKLKFLRLAEKLRVKSMRAEQLAKKTIENENRTLSMGSVQNDVNNDDDFTIL